MTLAERSALTGRSILLYDGVCGFCNRIVRLFLWLDTEGILRFAPLESSLALELIARFPVGPAEPEGIILLIDALGPEEAIYYRSDAVVQALRRLGGGRSVLGTLLYYIPRSWREGAYGVIARNRYRFFGKFDVCPIPTEAQRSRILGM